MSTNKDRITEWRLVNPSVQLTIATLKDLVGTSDLRGANLRGANLREADLWGANLREANLWGADLREANLWGADLGGADLGGANLWGADLWEANLGEADLGEADLREANLREANLRGANRWGGFQFNGHPSGHAVMVPTAEGWVLTVGCWKGSLESFRTMVEGTEWPESTGAEQERRRPGLLALASLAEAHQVLHADKLAAVVAKWGTKKEATE